LPPWQHQFRCQKRVEIRREEPARIYNPSLSPLKRWLSTSNSPKSLNSQIHFHLSDPLQTRISTTFHCHLLSAMQFSIFIFLAVATLSLVSASPAHGVYAIKPRLMPNATTIVSPQTVTATVTATLPAPTIPAPCTVCLVFESACIVLCLAGGPLDPFCNICVGAQMDIMIVCLEVSF
jgi:hypothetical protein